MGLLCALLASVVALTIPQVLRVLVNDSLQPGGARTQSGSPRFIILGLGVAEAGPRRPTPAVRHQPGNHGRNADAGIALRPPAGPDGLVPRPVAVRTAAQPHDAGHQHAAPLDGVRRRAARRQHPHDRRSERLLLFRWHWLLGTIFLVCSVAALVQGLPLREDYGSLARRARTRPATSRPRSRRASTASACSRRSAAASRRWRSSTTGRDAAPDRDRKAKHLATFSLVVTLLPELALGARARRRRHAGLHRRAEHRRPGHGLPPPPP